MRFHTSLPVIDVAETVAFYRALFEAEPVKTRADYAKFLPPNAGLNISFHELPDAARALSGLHVGLEVAGEAELDRAFERLTAAGLAPRMQGEVTCCYARQHKFWLTDPSGYRWEVYYVAEDTDEKTDPAAPCCPQSP